MMTWKNSCALMLVVVMVLAIGGAAQADVPETVSVGNPGNKADSTGYGAVAYEYRIVKYDQNGNMWEYNDSRSGNKVGLRGGSFFLNDNETYLRSTTRYDVLSAKWPNYGFRGRFDLGRDAGRGSDLPRQPIVRKRQLDRTGGGSGRYYRAVEDAGEGLDRRVCPRRPHPAQVWRHLERGVGPEGQRNAREPDPHRLLRRGQEARD